MDYIIAILIAIIVILSIILIAVIGKTYKLGKIIKAYSNSYKNSFGSIIYSYYFIVLIGNKTKTIEVEHAIYSLYKEGDFISVK